MQIHNLVLLLQLASAPATGSVELPMPPPPPGMNVLAVGGNKPAAEATPAAEAEEADDSPEAEEQSAELEEMRALEEAALDPRAKPNADILKTIRRLGLGNPLRRQMQDACEEPELREDSRPAELPQITDLATFDVGLIKDEYDIPVEMQPLVAQYIQFFQGPGRKWFRNWMARSTKFIPVMQPILEQRGLPKDTVYLAMIESGFSVHAASWAKAVGPWQFIPGTAKMMGLKLDFWVDERKDPIKATHAAARYLNELHEDLGHWYLAWAGYNTGGGRVRRLMAQRGSSDFWELSDGKGLAKETKHYVPKLIACALVAKNYKAFGFSDDEFKFQEQLSYDEVKVAAPTDLDVIARAAGVPVQEVHDLNPELRRWCTPPASEERPYIVRIPKGTAITFAQNFPKVAPSERLSFRIHQVKKGDTLSRIAATYKSAPEAILQFNRLHNAKALRVNTELAIPIPSARSAQLASATIERQVAKARRNGYVAARPDEEVPAGTSPRKAGKPELGTGKLDAKLVNGKMKITYGVREGDSLWSICQEYACTVEQLRGWNNLPKRTRALKVGTVLAIWQEEKKAPSASGGSGPVMAVKATVLAQAGKRTHQLAAGETLWSVAQRYSVSVDDLMKWNGISNHRTLKAGQSLVVSR